MLWWVWGAGIGFGSPALRVCFRGPGWMGSWSIEAAVEGTAAMGLSCVRVPCNVYFSISPTPTSFVNRKGPAHDLCPGEREGGVLPGAVSLRVQESR